LANRPFRAALLAWLAAQIIKTLIELVRIRKINLRLLIASGGMPSSHSAIMSAVAVSIGFAEGFGSPIFALAAVVALVVMYDASGVRRAAGNQAAAINLLLDNPENAKIRLEKKLKEVLGHTPFEVLAGAALGIVFAILFR